MKLLSNDLVMSGSLVPYDVAVKISLSNPRRSVNSPIANPLDNLFKVLKNTLNNDGAIFTIFKAACEYLFDLSDCCMKLYETAGHMKCFHKVMPRVK